MLKNEIVRLLAGVLVTVTVTGGVHAGQLLRGRSTPSPEIVGTWTVVQQTINPAPDNKGVTAYGDNDPSVLGLRLTISKNVISWEKPPRGKADISGKCPMPIYDGALDQPSLKSLRVELTVPLRKLKTPANQIIGRQFYICTGAGANWAGETSDQADFIMLKSGNVLLNWNDGLLLLLSK